MTSAQHRESANINASLHALKSCLRVLAERQNKERSSAKVPFRQSQRERESGREGGREYTLYLDSLSLTQIHEVPFHS